VNYPFHRESSGVVKASMEEAFAVIDTHSQLSAHMGRRSVMMGGGAMTLETDALEGRAVGSHIQLSGSAFGLRVEVDEVVTERNPPRHKAWETRGAPRLLVIAGYRMSVDLTPENGGCRIRVFIDYALPRQGVGRWLGAVFGHAYARWCTESMLAGIRKHFGA
jgi:hypothetical protein